MIHSSLSIVSGDREIQPDIIRVVCVVTDLLPAEQQKMLLTVSETCGVITHGSGWRADVVN